MEHRKFLKLFLECEGFLRAFLLAATGRPHEADDLLQEVSSVLWERFGEYDETRPFRAWATGVAKLEVLKWRQRLARSRILLSEEAVNGLAETAAALEEPDPRREELTSCVRALAAPLREILHLRYVQSMPIARIAEKTGKTIGAIEMMLVRTRRSLRECVLRRVMESGEQA